MKIKVSQIEPCKKLLKIEIPKEVVQEELDKIYQDINKLTQIPGFRKGKTPRKILEQHHSKTAKDEVLKKLIPSGYSNAVREHKINPVSMPEIGQVKLVDNEPLYFEATVDVEPEFELKKYKELRIEKRSFEVTDKDLNEALENLKEKYAEYDPIEDRAIKEDDYVIVDYETQVENSIIDKRENVWFYIKQDKKKPNDIIKNLVGAKIEEEIEIASSLPKNYFKSEFANKKAKIKIKVKQIRKKRLPELDEDFLKTLADYKSLDDLKEKLKEEIAKRKEGEVKFEVENQIVEQLISLNPLAVPSSMVKKQTEEMVNSAKERLIYQGLKKEEVDKKEDDLRKNLQKEAEKQVKVYFILERIADEEAIQVSDEDLKKKMDDIARRNKTDLEKVKEYLAKGDSLESLKGQIKHEKVMNFLVDEAKIKKA